MHVGDRDVRARYADIPDGLATAVIELAVDSQYQASHGKQSRCEHFRHPPRHCPAPRRTCGVGAAIILADHPAGKELGRQTPALHQWCTLES